MSNAITAEQIVKKYIELRNFVEAETKAFKTRMADYTSAMETLENLAGQMLDETGQRALSTESGTAFRVNKSRITCSDKDAFHAWVREINAWHFLTAHVAKEAVETWMEQNEGQLPPGIKYEGFTEVQFRKA